MERHVRYVHAHVGQIKGQVGHARAHVGQLEGHVGHGEGLPRVCALVGLVAGLMGHVEHLRDGWMDRPVCAQVEGQVGQVRLVSQYLADSS